MITARMMVFQGLSKYHIVCLYPRPKFKLIGD